MDIQEKVEIISKPPVCEIITKEELIELFETKTNPTHYIGFEISGKVHLGSGLMNAILINRFIQVGVKPTIFLADYHAWINGKLGGDLEKIQKVAKGYFKAAFVSLGLSEDKVNYVLASDLYDNDYWKLVLKISKETTIQRLLRCTTIMGRSAKDALDASSIIYPVMQAADIFMLGVDIAHAGTDQRKAHMLAREIAQKFSFKKPIAIHHSLLSGLLGPQKVENEDEVEIFSKMSKSKPESCIFIHDSEEEIKRKIKNAYCPPKVLDANPIIEICKYFILPQKPLYIKRDLKYGGDLQIDSFEALQKEYSNGNLHPLDLKKAVADELSEMLKPSREYFEKHKELLTQI